MKKTTLIATVISILIASASSIVAAGVGFANIQDIFETSVLGKAKVIADGEKFKYQITELEKNITALQKQLYYYNQKSANQKNASVQAKQQARVVAKKPIKVQTKQKVQVGSAANKVTNVQTKQEAQVVAKKLIKVQAKQRAQASTKKVANDQVKQKIQAKIKKAISDYQTLVRKMQKVTSEDASLFKKSLAKACLEVAKERKLDVILPAEISLYNVDSVDVTKQVIAKMH